jgi:hypothetical protein
LTVGGVKVCVADADVLTEARVIRTMLVIPTTTARHTTSSRRFLGVLNMSSPFVRP